MSASIRVFAKWTSRIPPIKLHAAAEVPQLVEAGVLVLLLKVVEDLHRKIQKLLLAIFIQEAKHVNFLICHLGLKERLAYLQMYVFEFIFEASLAVGDFHLLPFPQLLVAELSLRQLVLGELISNELG